MKSQREAGLATATEGTEEYIRRMSRLFYDGLLSRTPLYAPGAPVTQAQHEESAKVIQSLQEHLVWLDNWRSEVFEAADLIAESLQPEIGPASPEDAVILRRQARKAQTKCANKLKRERFMPIITYKQQRLSTLSMIGLIHHFHSLWPNHYLLCRRVNQSLLESSFGWARSLSGGNKAMTSESYDSAVGYQALMTQQRLLQHATAQPPLQRQTKPVEYKSTIIF
jgi:hypothetical protein